MLLNIIKLIVLLILTSIITTGCVCPSYKSDPYGHNQCVKRLLEEERLKAAAPQININTNYGFMPKTPAMPMPPMW